MGSCRTRRWLALGGVVLVAATQGMAGAATRSADRLTTAVDASKADEDPQRTYSGPFMAVDPANTRVIVAAFADMRTRRCGLMRSTDAGATWRRLDASPGLSSYSSCLLNNSNMYQATVAFGRGGTLYYLLAGWDVQDRAVGSGGNTDILLARSTDLGDTWQTTIVSDVRGAEGEKVENSRWVGNVAVDPRTGKDDIVYVTWQYDTPFVRAPNANPTAPLVAVSTDGGRTFGAPVNVATPAWADPANRQRALNSATATTLAPGATTTTIFAPAGSRAAQPDQPDNFGGRNPAVTLDSKGNVYALWFNVSANLQASTLAGQWMSKSTDRGKTWTAVQVASMEPATGSIGRIAWSPGGGPDGTLHVVSQTKNPAIAGEADIAYQQSTDGGRTWSTPARINDDDPASIYGQYIPMISTAPNGRVDVAWWDTRSDPGIRGNDVYYSHSEDDGKTWSKNQRITDRTVNRNYGVWGNNFDMSSPPGLASTDAFAVFGWDDTRNSDPTATASAGFGGGVQDIYVAAAQFETLGGGTSPAVKYALAGVVGLLAVGIVLLAAALAQRRPSTGGGRDRKAGKAPAAVG